MEKKIELCTVRAGDIKTEFGNPRKVKKKRLEELKEDLQRYGHFGIFLIDEENNVIAGNQRLKAVIDLYGEDAQVECKRLIGYTQQELRAINVKDNTHVGEWDMDMLADWSVGSPAEMGIADAMKKDEKNRKIPEMELLPYEKYDYVMLVCRSSLDYDDLVSRLGIQGAVCKVTNKRKIKARAVWYDKVRDILWGKDGGDRK